MPIVASCERKWTRWFWKTVCSIRPIRNRWSGTRIGKRNSSWIERRDEIPHSKSNNAAIALLWPDRGRDFRHHWIMAEPIPRRRPALVGFGPNRSAGNPRIAFSENSATSLSGLDGHWPDSWLGKHQNHPERTVLYDLPANGIPATSCGKGSDASQTGLLSQNIQGTEAIPACISYATPVLSEEAFNG
jgi:hypothetical protein